MTLLLLRPSPLDRLDPIAAAIRWWTSELGSLMGQPRVKAVHADELDQSKRRLPSKVSIVLGETDGFIARTRLPKGLAGAHAQALSHKLPDLAPVPPAALSIVASAVERNSDGALTYAVIMARKDRLAQLEAAARRRGATSVAFTVETAPDIALRSPAAEQKSRLMLIMDAVLVLGVIAAAMIAVAIWTACIEAETEALAAQERSLRRAAVAAETVRKDAGISTQLIERGLMSRRADTALRTLALLNQAMPETAWWTRLHWTPQETAISGQATDATAAIRQMSEAAKGWSIELAGPLTAAHSGSAQTFEIIVRERVAPPQ